MPEAATARQLARRLLCAAVIACTSAPLYAQPPQPAPALLDVVYVPTSQATVEAMLRVAGVGSGDFVIDLGSGDGRILIAAARLHGARGYGVDLDPLRVQESIENARAAGVADRASFAQGNLFDTPVGEASVVTLYLLPRINLQLRPRLLRELKPGARVVAHAFDMGDWQPDLKVSVRGERSNVYLWIIPAQVAGRWRVRREAGSFDIEIQQKYQEIEATVGGQKRQVRVIDTRLEGSRIAFTVVDESRLPQRVRYEGRVSGNAMEGVAREDGVAAPVEHPWRAVRAR